MKRAGFLFDEICSSDNFREALLQSIRGKSEKPDVVLFCGGLENSLENLRRSFSVGDFRLGRYEYFMISDPKKRLICAASFPERIIHHALMNILDPLFEGRQISDSYACRRGKGTRAAVLRGFHFVKGNRYFLKMDVRKYFDSIDHAILKDKLSRKIKDERVLRALWAIIDSYETAPGRGIPIGNLTSQYFANDYLASLDHYGKETLRRRAWVRYMDDILVCGDDRSSLEEVYDKVSSFCRDKLALMLKPKILDATKSGAPFLGFSLRPSGIFLSSKRKRRFERKARAINHRLRRGRIAESEAADRMTAMIAHCLVARSRSFRYRVFHGSVLGRQPRESRRELEQ